MAEAIPRVPSTTRGVRALGTTRLKRIRQLEAPRAREAATKSSSLICSTEARMTRAYWGIVTMAIARRAFLRPGTEHGDDGYGQEQGGKAQDHVGHPHDHVVDPTSPVAGHRAENRSDQHGDGHGREADRQADPGAVDDSGELITGIAVETENVLGTSRRTAKRVDTRWIAAGDARLPEQAAVGVVGGDRAGRRAPPPPRSR